MIKKFLKWLKFKLTFTKKHFYKGQKMELKDVVFPYRKLMEHEKPIEGADPIKLASARKYAHTQKQTYFAQMQKYGKSKISDRTIRRDIEKLYGIKIQETNSAAK